MQVGEAGAVSNRSGQSSGESVIVEQKLLLNGITDAIGNGSSEARLLQPEYNQTLEIAERGRNGSRHQVAPEEKLLKPREAAEPAGDSASEAIVVHPEDGQKLKIRKRWGNGPRNPVAHEEYLLQFCQLAERAWEASDKLVRIHCQEAQVGEVS